MARRNSFTLRQIDMYSSLLSLAIQAKPGVSISTTTSISSDNIHQLQSASNALETVPHLWTSVLAINLGVNAGKKKHGLRCQALGDSGRHRYGNAGFTSGKF